MSNLYPWLSGQRAEFVWPKFATFSVFIFLFASLLLACGGTGAEDGSSKKDGENGPDSRPQAVTVRVDTAREQLLMYYDQYPGTVVALEQVEVRPQLAGYITKVHFREGEQVRRGQRLYTIDARRYDAEVDQADARISSAQANVNLAEKNVARYRRLAEAEAIAVQTLDRAEAELKVAREDLGSARAGKRSANTQLDYTTITSPITGVTGLASVKVGTQVSPGNPLLTTVSQLEPLGVDFALPQNLIPRLSQLEGKSLAALDSTFRLRLPGGGEDAYSEYGRVYALDGAVDSRTGNLTVRLAFANTQGLLRPGMNVQVEMLHADAGKQILIPRRALGEQMGEQFVFVKRDSVVLRTRVKTGRQLDSNVIITEGLSGGELVVIAGIKGLRDSTRVRLAEPRGVTSSTSTQRAPAAVPAAPRR